jgi:hypothetical protein
MRRDICLMHRCVSRGIFPSVLIVGNVEGLPCLWGRKKGVASPRRRRNFADAKLRKEEDDVVELNRAGCESNLR